MISERILELREMLNESIISGKPYEVVYKLSVDLDEAIAKYYKEKMALIV